MPFFAQTESARLSLSDSIRVRYVERLDSLRGSYRRFNSSEVKTLGNPYYFPLFAAGTLLDATTARVLGSLPAHGSGLRSDAMSEDLGRFLLWVYTERPWLVVHNNTKTDAVGLRSDVDTIVSTNEWLSAAVEKVQKVEPVPPIQEIAGEDVLRIEVRKPNFWDFKSRFKVQFLQNHVSDNWYQGGESNLSMQAETTLEANYDNKQKIEFNNKLEMKLGFQTSENDELHKFKPNSDLLRLTNKFGLKAGRDWNYTLMLQSWTQFTRGYRANDPKVYSDFMSPFESIFSLGMEYKPKVKNFTLKATISPLACKFKYVDRGDLATSFGLEAGKHSKIDYGSTVTITFNWDLFKNVNWTGRIYYFTDYSKSQFEWENTIRLTINRYLSTNVFLYPRFDDSRERKDGESYFQFKEWISLGLDLTF